MVSSEGIVSVMGWKVLIVQLYSLVLPKVKHWWSYTLGYFKLFKTIYLGYFTLGYHSLKQHKINLKH